VLSESIVTRRLCQIKAKSSVLVMTPTNLFLNEFQNGTKFHNRITTTTRLDSLLTTKQGGVCCSFLVFPCFSNIHTYVQDHAASLAVKSASVSAGGDRIFALSTWTLVTKGRASSDQAKLITGKRLVRIQRPHWKSHLRGKCQQAHLVGNGDGSTSTMWKADDA